MTSDNSLTVVTKAAVSFLGRICNPAADEIGLLLQDKVKAYRNKNFSSIAQKAEEKVNAKAGIDPKINPRLLYSIYEHGSWSDSDKLQDMWAGILAASCFDDVSDQNILYIDILSKMSVTEALIFSYVAENTDWSINESTTLPESNSIFPKISEIRDACRVSDLDKLDESMTHLTALGLIRFEEYPDIERFTSKSNPKHGEIDEDDFYNPDWGYSVELSLTQIGYRLYLKVTGESLGLKQYIQKNHTSNKESRSKPEWY